MCTVRNESNIQAVMSSYSHDNQLKITSGKHERKSAQINTGKNELSSAKRKLGKLKSAYNMCI